MTKPLVAPKGFPVPLSELRAFALAFAGRCGADRTAREDIAQEVLIRAVRSFESWIPSPDVPIASALRRWTAGIVLHVWSDMRTATQRRRQAPLEHAPAMSVPASEGETHARDLLAYFRGATTPERWRAFIAMELDGVTIEEFARTEGAPANTIYTRIRLAREDFAAALLRLSAAERGPAVRRRRT